MPRDCQEADRSSHPSLLGQCPTIRVGDYVEINGEKLSEVLFDATDVWVSR